MEDKATAPGILKKSTASAYSTEEKIRNLEKKVEEYKERLAKIEDSLFDMFDEEEEEYPPVRTTPFTISWMANEQPRVTQRDREIAIWKTWTKDTPDLHCSEKLE